VKRRMRISADELIVDNFAGGGGASRGIELALGRSPDIAVNHDPEAIAMHEANHPLTRHFCESVWKVDPRAVTRGRPVGLAWFSPDCTFHSKARGGLPFRDPKSAKGRRGLAWVVVRWARAVKPRVIALENVEEFQAWGPLGEDGRPCPARRGRTFHRWVAQLRDVLNEGIDWVIVGGESGPGARPMHVEWVRELRDAAVARGIPFFFKQWGRWVDVGDAHELAERGIRPKAGRVVNLEGGHGFHGRVPRIMRPTTKARAGRLLDGRTWDEVPEHTPTGGES